jgi:hypothetical protein
MNGTDFQLEIRRNQLIAEAPQPQALNCSQLGQAWLPQLGQAWGGQCLGSPYWIAPCPCPSLGDYEISIQQIGDGEPVLNYGAKLRLIMAEPLKGIDLREAIAKLKSALKQCKNEH